MSGAHWDPKRLGIIFPMFWGATRNYGFGPSLDRSRITCVPTSGGPTISACPLNDRRSQLCSYKEKPPQGKPCGGPNFSACASE